MTLCLVLKIVLLIDNHYVHMTLCMWLFGVYTCVCGGVCTHVRVCGGDDVLLLKAMSCATCCCCDHQ